MNSKGIGITGVALFSIAFLIVGILLAEPSQSGSSISSNIQNTSVGVGNYLFWFLVVFLLAMVVADVIILFDRLGLFDELFSR